MLVIGLKPTLFWIGLVFIFTNCLVVEQKYSKLPPGIWRGALEIERPLINPNADLLEEGITTDVAGGIYIPFTFEVNYDESDNLSIDFINGEERITINHIAYGTDRTIAKDTFTIYFDVYDSYLKGICFEGIMQGKWVRSNRENYEIPFTAHFGEKNRFPSMLNQPEIDISGRWACQFEIETETPYPAVGEFVQNGKNLSGTFMTEIGDYRYLEGTVQENEIKMSVFDGAHAFLFEAKYKQDSLIGSFYSGNHYKCLWSGKRDDQASLTNPDSLTYLRVNQSFHFEFPDSRGDLKSLDDYSTPIKIIQIMGTWCPNCRDETKFLVDYFSENPNNQISVIALAFESYRDPQKSFHAIENYKNHFAMEYDILLAGYRDKTEASAKLPMLNEIISYPTLIFLDKNNNVRKIHTGFNGPATSKYNEFVEGFEQTISDLMEEI